MRFCNGPSKLMFPAGLGAAQDKVKEREEKLVKAIDARDKLLAEAEVKCLNDACGRSLVVKELTYRQTFWYTPPHGCTGGDYWNAGEGQFICPHCKMLNRMLGKDVEKLKPHFKDVEKVYKDD